MSHPSFLLSLYTTMLRIRMVEEAIVERYPEQEMRCPTHLCIGQEAPPAGVSAHLVRRDLVFSGHRSHGHFLAKGGDLRAMFAELYGRVTGCARGKGGSQHLVDLANGFVSSAPILASTIPVAAGAAWGAVMAGEDRVVVAYLGDGATEEGAFHEALNFAGAKRLPIIFVCENNLYSVHTALEARQPNRPIAALGAANGMASATGDGNDVEEVSSLAKAAVERARGGGGPTLLELFTYRWKEHCGPASDIGLGYRSEAELATWMARDPLIKARRRLVAGGELDDASDEDLRREISAEIEDAIEFARQSPFPEPAELHRHLYGTAGAIP